MFEVPDWAECSASSVPGMPTCLRSVTKMVSIISRSEGDEVDFDSKGTCNRHVEILEAYMASLSDLPPITVTRAEFPAFVADMLGG